MTQQERMIRIMAANGYYPKDDIKWVTEKKKLTKIMEDIVVRLEAEKGLTYAGAYEVLMNVILYLKYRSNYVSLEALDTRLEEADFPELEEIPIFD